MDFIKVEGLGNDFIVVDGPMAPDPDLIVAWCDRRFGIGADGVLEMTRVSSDRIRMRYWNADGGEAEMCGNGLRCLVKLAVERQWVDTPHLTVETAAGPLSASLQPDGLIRALVGVPETAGDPFEFEGLEVHPVRVGNPHAVVFVPDPQDAPVDSLGPRLEHHDRFADRANVEFVATGEDQRISVRIWERGVGETMASGTGATAAAYAAAIFRGVESPVTVSLPGGELRIELEPNGAWMVGPGNVVYRGSL